MLATSWERFQLTQYTRVYYVADAVASTGTGCIRPRGLRSSTFQNNLSLF
jgi:hypothetical protein